MKKLPVYLLLFLLCCCFVLPAFGQFLKLPFWQEIQHFKKQDSLQAPPKGAIVFVGSSSIRLWPQLAADFPDHIVINRGFGGSTLPDLKNYLNDIVLPYQPAKVVIYSGENDIATGKVSAQDVLKRFADVFTAIRKEMPQVPITFISIKPSPSRQHFMPLIVEANALIKAYLKDKPQTQFVDIYSPMLDSDGMPRNDIFITDNLHMNEKGYKIWAEAIRPFL